MNDAFLRDILFPLIRAGLRISAETISEPIDYPLLSDVADKQAILPIIREGLCAMQLQDGGAEIIQKKCKNDIYLFACRDFALNTIEDCFEKNAIEYVLLKGSVLRDLYPDQWMRTSCDIDVLVKEEKLDKAVSALQKETDFAFLNKLYHDVSMSSPPVHLELHFNIKEDMDNIDKLLTDAWNHAIRKADTHQYVFTPEFQIFHVISHMSYHFVHGGLGVRPYLDLWLLRNKTQYDEKKVRDMCDKCGILKFYEECCNLSDVWLKRKEHTNITKALEQYSFEGGLFGNRKNASIAIMRKNKGIKYYFTRLFVKRQSLELLYPKLKKYPRLLPYYQAKRWIDAIVQKPDKIKREIKIVKHLDKKEIENLKELFDFVGL
ncbi:MAG: nucleotidyltransferase family protein [Clostridia bacterium]|nr:nucleotidyltransferase family protein [Clostridia bacterium]